MTFDFEPARETVAEVAILGVLVYRADPRREPDSQVLASTRPHAERGRRCGLNRGKKGQCSGRISGLPRMSLAHSSCRWRRMVLVGRRVSQGARGYRALR